MRASIICSLVLTLGACADETYGDCSRTENADFVSYVPLDDSSQEYQCAYGTGTECPTSASCDDNPGVEAMCGLEGETGGLDDTGI